MSGRGKGLSRGGPSGSGSKRTFTPNLAVAGKRQTPVQESESTPKNDNDGKKKKWEKNRDKDKKRSGGRDKEIVETAGLFSAGLLNKTKTSESTGSWGGGSSAGSGSTIGGNKYRRVKIDDDDNRNEASSSAYNEADFGTDEDALKDLLHDDKFIADLKEGRRRPLNLSVPDQKRDFGINKPLAGLKLEASPQRKSLRKKDLFEIVAAADQSDCGEIFLMQLPDALSKMLKKSKEEENVSTDSIQVNVEDESPQNSTAAKITNAETSTQKWEHCLDALPEGRIGKLKIFKSGKAQLDLGNLTLDVELGAKSKFRQELASINFDENTGDDKTGEIKVLGSVQHRINCLPNIDNLFEKSDT